MTPPQERSQALLDSVDAAAVLEAAPDALLVVDAQGTMLWANQRAQALFGYQRSELLGEPVEVLVPDRFRGEHVGHREAYMEEPQVRPMGAGLDLYGVHKDGTEIPVEISLSPLQTGGGIHVLAAVRDMTEHVQTHRALRRYARELEQTNVELEQFGRVVAHDLREPLVSIRGFADLLQEHLAEELDDASRTYLAAISRGAARMDSLIQGLREYANVGGQEIHVQPVDTAELVDGIIEDLSGLISATSGTVEQGQLPTVEADPSIHSVFHNLLVNALKFHGDQPPRVRVEGETTGQGWRFTVADQGLGIEPAQQDKVFTIFHSLDTQGPGPRGQGIGLAICKKVVEAHGGGIQVASEPGDGAVFTFHVPRP